MKKYIYIFITLLSTVFINVQTVNAQLYPVQASTQMLPPYTVLLSGYASPGNQSFMLQLLLTDLTTINYQVKLRLTIEGPNIKLVTRANYMPPPITLQGGLPEIYTGADISNYFDPNNLDFTGMSRAEFQRSGKLPEGFYRFTVEVLDYNKGIAVSRPGANPATAWLILNDPPLINLPSPDEKVRASEPQNVIFQWMPRHTGSPNSAFTTEYVFTLVEIWPEGRNPGDAILTGRPIYETVTPGTRLIYDMMAPPLEPGRQYAFRVQARDMMGRDLFKNNGYTEAQMFIFGDECKPPVNISGAGQSDKTAKITYTPGYGHTEFEIKYREDNNPVAEWFTLHSALGSVYVSGLKPATTYQYIIRAVCGTLGSDYSDTNRVATKEKVISDFVCGKPDNIPAIANTTPIPSLAVGDVITVGAFPVLITEVSGGSGQFTGKGEIRAPYFQKARIRVKFDGIKVNTEKQVFEGAVTTIYNPDSRFLLDVDEALDNLGPSDDNDTTAPGGTTEVVDIRIDGVVDTVYINPEDSTIVIVTEDGTTTTVPPGDEVVITDSEGNTTYVDAEGNITTVPAGGGALAGGDGSQAAQDSVLAKLQVISFTASGAQLYGFDRLEYDQLKPSYGQEAIKDQPYFIPWKSVAANSTDKVNAIIPQDSALDKSKITFSLNGQGLPMMDTEKDYIKQLTVNGRMAETVESVEAYYTRPDDTKELLGKLNVISYEKQTVNVVIVPVNDDDCSISMGLLRDQLNKIYGQAVSDWVVTKGDKPVTVDLEGAFDDGETGLLSNYTDDMKTVINAFNDQYDRDKNAYYLFMVSNPASGSSKMGYMPFKQQFGFIFVDNCAGQDALIRTIAHELGHGPFRLRHTFSTENTYHLPEGQTNNLMDYGQGAVLNKYQWDFIHDPQGGLYLFEGEEEMVMRGIDIKFITKKIKEAYENKNEYLELSFIYSTFADYAGSLDLDGFLFSKISVNTGSAKIEDMLKPFDGKNYRINPKNCTKIELTFEGDETPYIKFEYKSQRKVQGIPPFSDSWEDTEEPVIWFFVKLDEADKFEEYLYGKQDLFLSNVTWISQFSSEINGRACHWCGSIGLCCNGGTICNTCSINPSDKCCNKNCSDTTLITACDTCKSGIICDKKLCRSNNCCYETSCAMIEKYNLSTDRAHAIDNATLITNNSWKQQSDLIANSEKFIEGTKYINETLKSGKPVVIGVHYSNDKDKTYNSNKATFHFMVVVGKYYKNDQKYYRFYDPGRTNATNGKAETNLLLIDEGLELIHGFYNNKTYTITEIRKNK